MIIQVVHDLKTSAKRFGGIWVIALIFLSLLFLETARKPSKKKKQGFFILSEPLKSLRRKGKTLKKARNSLERKKARNSQKARKGRSGCLPVYVFLNQPSWLCSLNEGSGCDGELLASCDCDLWCA